MQEIEIKLQIPNSYKKILNQELKNYQTEKIHLHAQYFDTPDQLLSKNKMAIRLRKENEIWVQTFKASGKNHLERYENEVERGIFESVPMLDLNIYENENRLNQVLDKEPLAITFETIFERTIINLDNQHACVEVALDKGKIVSNDKNLLINEIEFELKSGSIEGLFEIIRPWIKKYHLWVDVRSKAECGHLLYQNKIVSPALIAPVFSLNFNEITHSFLANIAAITDGIAEQEHYLQAEKSLVLLLTAILNEPKLFQYLDILNDIKRSLSLICIAQNISPHVSIKLTNPKKILIDLLQQPKFTFCVLTLLQFNQKKLRLHNVDIDDVKFIIDQKNYKDALVLLRFSKYHNHHKLISNLQKLVSYTDFMNQLHQLKLKPTEQSFIKGWLSAKHETLTQKITKQLKKI